MFRSLAGIDSDGPGFEKLIIRPGAPDPHSDPDATPISWVGAEYDSPHGTITTRWKREGEHFVLDLLVPANVTANVELPTTDAQSVTEGGKPINDVPAIRVTGPQGDRLGIEIPSGRYHFECSLKLFRAGN